MFQSQLLWSVGLLDILCFRQKELDIPGFHYNFFFLKIRNNVLQLKNRTPDLKFAYVYDWNAGFTLLQLLIFSHVASFHDSK